MSYNGYLVKISVPGSGANAALVPFSAIRYNSFSATYQPIDVDSYEDGNGELHRETLDRRKLQVEWKTPEMNNAQMQSFFKLLRDRMVTDTAKKEQKIRVEAYVPFLDKYITDDCYLTSQLVFPIKKADSSDITYAETRIALIGYSTATATI